MCITALYIMVDVVLSVCFSSWGSCHPSYGWAPGMWWCSSHTSSWNGLWRWQTTNSQAPFEHYFLSEVWPRSVALFRYARCLCCTSDLRVKFYKLRGILLFYGTDVSTIITKGEQNRPWNAINIYYWLELVWLAASSQWRASQETGCQRWGWGFLSGRGRGSAAFPLQSPLSCM